MNAITRRRILRNQRGAGAPVDPPNILRARFGYPVKPFMPGALLTLGALHGLPERGRGTRIAGDCGVVATVYTCDTDGPALAVVAHVADRFGTPFAYPEHGCTVRACMTGAVSATRTHVAGVWVLRYPLGVDLTHAGPAVGQPEPSRTRPVRGLRVAVAALVAVLAGLVLVAGVAGAVAYAQGARGVCSSPDAASCVRVAPGGRLLVVNGPKVPTGPALQRTAGDGFEVTIDPRTGVYTVTPRR